MTPMPLNPKVVLLVDKEGTVLDDRNNIGNDVTYVITHYRYVFELESAGVPYSGITDLNMPSAVLASKK